MRITGPRSTSPASTRKAGRATPASGETFAQSLDANSAGKGAAKPTPAAPLAAVDALLQLQEAPDGTDGRSRGLKRAGEMLDMLEAVRRGLLLGAIPRAQLERLARLARERQQDFDDPALAELLREIELRAEVELAKLGISS